MATPDAGDAPYLTLSLHQVDELQRQQRRIRMRTNLLNLIIEAEHLERYTGWTETLIDLLEDIDAAVGVVDTVLDQATALHPTEAPHGGR